MAEQSNQGSESAGMPNWINKWTVGAAAVICGVGAAAYSLTRPTKPKKVRKHRPDNRPKTRKYEKTITRKPLDIHVVMRNIDDGFHAHVAADKKNKKLNLVIGSALVKINGEKVENESFDAILTKLQTARYPVTLAFREFPELQQSWEEADRLKEEANEVYKENQIERALEIMQQAINLHPTNKVYYSNRVLMLLKKKDHEAALSDCQTMRELDPLSLYVKGHYLRGLVLMNLEKYKHARSAFQTVLKINSGFKKASERLQECLAKLAEIDAQNEQVVEQKEQAEQQQEQPPQEQPAAVIAEESAADAGAPVAEGQDVVEPPAVDDAPPAASEEVAADEVPQNNAEQPPAQS